ncbi:hypothetical protein F4777DRAFT_78030 [Nemania sp. FL0916]|nr:hypothetical protein F4777DRAFT_78030 [Nemania sp. FL0916]
MQLQAAFALFSAVAVATATPLGRRCEGTGPGTGTGPAPGHDPTPSNGVTYTLPSTGGPTQLPAPNATLQHIAVGHGVQNYTCSAAGSAATSVGALAVLYDITALYPGSGPAAVDATTWAGLTGTVLRTTSMPIDATAADPFPAPASITVSGIAQPLPFVGHHFFDLSGTPTFDLSTSSQLFKGQKLVNIPAPASADKGLNGEGAVDWLYLGNKGGSVGVSKVYRVLTAGGAGAVCGAAGETQSVPYTAMYWVY